MAFITQSDLGGVTVAEGTDGVPAANACIDQELVYQTPLVVTFYNAGVYHITCRKAPLEMFTVVIVL